MVNTPEQAIAKAAALKDGPKFGTGLCLREVRTCYGVPAQAPDAAAAWWAAKLRHRTTDPTSIPRGAPVFWTGGTSGHGHIAISTGGGNCWSTDILRAGYFDHVPINLIHQRWGLTLVGWTEDLNSVRVWTPSPAKPEVTPVTTKYTPKVAGLYAQITSLANQILTATTNGTPNHEDAEKIRELSHLHDGIER